METASTPLEYFMYKDGQQMGPVSKDNLLEKGLTPETLVWRQGMTDWTPAYLVSDLASLFRQETVQEETPPPVPPQSSQDSFKETVIKEETSKPKHPYHRFINYIFIAAFLALMVFTCPGKEKHQQAIINVITTSLMKDTPSGNSPFDMFGALIVPSVSRMMLEGMMDVKQFGLVSVGFIDSKPITIGVLGNVFVLHKDKIDLKNILHKNKDEDANWNV